VTCTTSAPLAVGDTVSYQVTVSVGSGFGQATLDNTAQIASTPVGDPDPANDDATDSDTVVRVADLSVTIDDAPDPVVLGNDVTYTFHVHNAGPSDAANVAVTSALPAELDWVSGDPGCSFALGIVVCDAGTIAAGGNASFDVVLTPNVTGVVGLDAAVGTSATDSDLSNNDATAGTTVLAPPPLDVDLGVSLGDTPDPVGEDGALSYALSVDNAGPGNADNVTLTQQLPPTTTFQSASPGCSELAGVVTCNVGTLNTGASYGATVIVTAPSSVQALSSTLSAATTSNDSNPANDDATAPTAMVGGGGGPWSADLGVTVTDAPDPVNAGGSVTYSIGVSNAGPDDATNTTVSFTLPPGASFTSATPSQGTCSQAAGVVTCPLATVANGGAASISVVVILHTEGVAAASATVSSPVPDPVGANNAAGTTTTVNPVADLAVTKTDNATTVTAGTSATYTISLSNAGPSSAAAGVVVVDHIPVGTTAHVTDPSCAIAGTDVTCTTSSPLASGASVSWQVVLDVPLEYAGTGVDNVAAVQSTPTFDPNAANDTAADHDGLAPAGADLTIFKEDVPDPVNAGERITYTITVTNEGPADAEDVVITDPVPAATTVDDVKDGGTESAGVVTWNVGDIAVGQSVSVHLIVLVDANHDGDVTNTATVASATPDPDPTDNSATAVTTDDPAGADLDLVKTVDADSAAVGDVVTYEITVTNHGPADATGVIVKDALPKGLDYISSKADRGSYDEHSGHWNVGDLPLDAVATLHVRTRITSDAHGTLTNLATVAGLDQTDQTPANDEAEANVEVLAADVEIVDPTPDDEALAFTGWNFGLAFEITLFLLIMGIGLMVVGRRLEHRSSPEG
jgi:large repetitive protein